MRVLITGSTGFVGKHLCEALRKQSYKFIGVVRSKNVDGVNAEQIVVAEINGTTNWKEALIGIDVVIHLAARVHVINDSADDPIAEFRKVNVDGTLRLAEQAAKAGVKRFVFISSIGVNGAQTKLPFTEIDNPNPHNPYAISKWEAEQGLQKIALRTELEIVIIRPPLVYGAYAPGNFASLIRAVKSSIPLPLGAINNRRSFVYVQNLVSLILCCINHPEAANETFLVSDGHDLSTTELLRCCALALGVRARLLPVPQKIIEVCATILAKRDIAQRLCGNLQVDITKTQSLLGWVPPVSVADGLKATSLGLIEK